jgi:hypothetical protein
MVGINSGGMYLCADSGPLVTRDLFEDDRYHAFLASALWLGLKGRFRVHHSPPWQKRNGYAARFTPSNSGSGSIRRPI